MKRILIVMFFLFIFTTTSCGINKIELKEDDHSMSDNDVIPSTESLIAPMPTEIPIAPTPNHSNDSAPITSDENEYFYEDIAGYDSYKDDILDRAGLTELMEFVTDSNDEITAIVTDQVEKGLLSEKGEATVMLFKIMINSVYHYPVLVIDYGGEPLYKYLTAPDSGAYGSIFYLNDIDGDGYDEIITQNTTDNTGGAGIHISAVYKLEGDTLAQLLFDTRRDRMDTGFYLVLDNGFKFIIKNKYTTSETVFIREDHETPYFDDNGDITDEAKKNNEETHFSADSFYMFEPIDFDGDGTYEIMTAQYCSLWGHSDAVGVAYSILKYNNLKGKMEVVKTGFWQYLDIAEDEEESYYEQWEHYEQSWYKD